MRSLFIFDKLDMNAKILGGVQLCSQEFKSIVESASESMKCCEISICRQMMWRIKRKLHLGAYLLYNPKELKAYIEQSLHDQQPTHIFLNRSELLRLTPLLKKLAPTAKVILMSHGNQSGDDLYELSGVRGRRVGGLLKFISIWQIGLDLATESWFRHRYIDLVCVMSREEEILERWLGAKNTVVLPRKIQVELLDWNPILGRVGFVGTLDHTPNRVALEQICKEISSRNHQIDIDLRIVGKPESLGEYLASEFKFVTYLGALDDKELKLEVSSWNLFLNPIFWLSRGASMKLEKAISWGIPFLTTRSGCRGYQINNINDASFLITSDSCYEFVEKLFEIICNPQNINKARDLVINTGTNSPQINDLSKIITESMVNLG